MKKRIGRYRWMTWPRISGLATLWGMLVVLAACGHRGAAPGIQASERMACQKAPPTEQAACLERARVGTVIYVPERLEHPGERLDRRRRRH